MIRLFQNLSEPIGLIDVGAVGDLPEHWLPFAHQLSVYGFEPDREACEKLNRQSHRFASATFFPYAIAGKTETRPFHFARYGECSSLLSPDMQWLNRFSYGSWFEIARSVDLPTRSLDEVHELEAKKIDALKIDSQGMEVPILRAAKNILSQVFLLEVETGVHPNYHHETTFDQLAPFLRELGFTCMQLKTQPNQPRANHAEHWTSNKGQPMACESIWLKDLSVLPDSPHFLSQGKALRCLALCALFGFLDFGVELCSYFFEKKVISESLQKEFQEERAWIVQEPPRPPRIASILAHLSHLLPTPLRRDLARVLPEIAERPNFLKKILP